MPHLNSSIFLKSGAFVRWLDQVYVFQGPFEALPPVKRHAADFGIQHFFHSEMTPYRAAHREIMDPEEFFKFLNSIESTVPQWKWRDPLASEYQLIFDAHMSQIRSGKYRKAVPFVFAESDTQPSAQDLGALLKKIHSFSSPLIPFGFWNEGQGLLGLTPETLFHQKKSSIKSMALAGTEKKLGTPPQLMGDEKILREHQIVVDELLKKWAGWGHVKAEALSVLELPTLYHLCTPLQIQLQKTPNPFHLVQALHPTSAVGVDPSDQWRSLESLPGQKQRDFFGAPLCFCLHPEESLALVALRQVQWNNKGIRLGAGGGIVEGSSLQLEWREILAKIESVKTLLGVN